MLVSYSPFFRSFISSKVYANVEARCWLPKARWCTTVAIPKAQCSALASSCSCDIHAPSCTLAHDVCNIRNTCIQLPLIEIVFKKSKFRSRKIRVFDSIFFFLMMLVLHLSKYPIIFFRWVIRFYEKRILTHNLIKIYICII